MYRRAPERARFAIISVIPLFFSFVFNSRVQHHLWCVHVEPSSCWLGTQAFVWGEGRYQLRKGSPELRGCLVVTFLRFYTHVDPSFIIALCCEYS